MSLLIIRNGQVQVVKVNVENATASRAFDTNYQNNSGKTRLVIIATNHLTANAFDGAKITAYVDNVSPPTAVSVAHSGIDVGSALLSLDSTFVFIVPVNYYYQVGSYVAGAGSSNTLKSWIEIDFN